MGAAHQQQGKIHAVPHQIGSGLEQIGQALVGIEGAHIAQHLAASEAWRHLGQRWRGGWRGDSIGHQGNALFWDAAAAEFGRHCAIEGEDAPGHPGHGGFFGYGLLNRV